MGAAELWSANVAGEGEPEKIWALRMTPEILPMLGVRPRLGRFFLPSEARPGSDRVILISDGLWRRRFASDPAVLGRTVRMNGDAYTIVGVMPPGFVFAPFWATSSEIWAPLDLSSRASNREGSSLRVFARLRSGVSLAAALLAAIGIYGVMSYAVSQRIREIGVRVALGASPPEVLRLVVGQGLRMAGAGALAGLAAALALTRGMTGVLYGVRPSDPLTYAVVAAALVAVALVASWGPARLAARLDPVEALRAE